MVSFLVHQKVKTSLQNVSGFDLILLKISSNIHLDHMLTSGEDHRLYQIIYFIFIFIKEHPVSIIIGLNVHGLHEVIVVSVSVEIQFKLLVELHIVCDRHFPKVLTTFEIHLSVAPEIVDDQLTSQILYFMFRLATFAITSYDFDLKR